MEFRAISSTELVVTSLYDELLQNMDDKNVTCSIFYDLQKAFDSVNHTIILKKLSHNGFCRSTLWILQQSAALQTEILKEINKVGDKK